MTAMVTSLAFGLPSQAWPSLYFQMANFGQGIVSFGFGVGAE